jgi:acyl dehydratase
MGKIYQRKFGGYLDDFHAGDIYKHWPGKTITEGDNNLFSLITMNHHPLHIDSNYAAGQQHKKILVVGTLVVSLVVGMSVPDISGKAIANLDYEKIIHEAPVFIGDTLYAETEILNVKESKSNPLRGIIYVETKAYNQNGTLVLTLRRHVLVPKKANKNEQ